MSLEKYTQIYCNESVGTTVRPFGASFVLHFDLAPAKDQTYRLFTVGETEQFYLWKNEPDYPRFASDTVDGVPLQVCENPLPPDAVYAVTDSGRPLLCDYRIGKGTLTVFHAKEYPAHPALRTRYAEAIRRLCGETVAREPIFAEAKDDVEFAVYRQADGSRHVYFLAVDWYHAPEAARSAVLRLGEDRYEIPVPFGTLLKCVCRSDVAVIAESEDGEVLSVSEGEALVQGQGRVTFRICKDGQQRTEAVDFSQNGTRRITL